MSVAGLGRTALTFRRLLPYYALISVPLVLTVAFGTARIPVRDDVRNLLFDYYQWMAPRAYDPDTPVRIIDIDDESLRRGGQWPWPRSRIATLVDRLIAAHAAAVGFDFLFSEPDRNDIGPSGAADAGSAARPTPDAAFARSLAGNPVVLAAVLTNGVAGADMPGKSGFAAAGDDPKQFLTTFPGGVQPLPALADAAAGIGAINWLPDHDKTVRRVPLILALGDTLVPSLALEILRVAQGASTYVVKASNASGERAFGEKSGVIAIKIGQVVVPTQAAGDMRLRFTRPEPRRYVPAWQVLANDPAAGLDGKIVVVGSSAAGLNDIIATPLSAAMPGVEVQAQLIEQILSGDTLVRPDYAEGAEFLTALVLSLAFVVALPRVSALTAGLAGGVAALAIAGGSWWAFQSRGLLFDPLFPSIGPGAVFLTGVYALYGIKRRQEEEVRQVFGRFVSPAVVARLAEHPERLKLGGDRRELTLMFCDLRSFTNLSEGLTAQDLTRFLNDYLTPMTDIILDQAGTIDKYMGDAIMAFWNAPLDDSDHRFNGTRSALRMRAALRALNETWTGDATTYGKVLPKIRFGIGLNTGIACVGNLGSIRRFDYSVIGDEVNVTARLESAAKYFGVDIVAGEATRAGAPDHAWLKIADVVLKGKTTPVAVFALAGDEAYARTPAFTDLSRLHESMLEACDRRVFGDARALAVRASALAPPEIAGLYRFNQDRFTQYEALTLDETWTPVVVLEDK